MNRLAIRLLGLVLLVCPTIVAKELGIFALIWRKAYLVFADIGAKLWIVPAVTGICLITYVYILVVWWLSTYEGPMK